MSYTKPYPFEIDHIDEWGNKHVICEVCKLVFKRDGIIRHAKSMSGHESFITKYNDFSVDGPPQRS